MQAHLQCTLVHDPQGCAPRRQQGRWSSLSCSRPQIISKTAGGSWDVFGLRKLHRYQRTSWVAGFLTKIHRAFITASSPFQIYHQHSGQQARHTVMHHPAHQRAACPGSYATGGSHRQHARHASGGRRLITSAPQLGVAAMPSRRWGRPVPAPAQPPH